MYYHKPNRLIRVVEFTPTNLGLTETLVGSPPELPTSEPTEAQVSFTLASNQLPVFTGSGATSAANA